MNYQVINDEQCENPMHYSDVQFFVHKNRYFSGNSDSNLPKNEKDIWFAVLAYVHGDVSFFVKGGYIGQDKSIPHPFTCRFDSAMCGYVFMSKESIREIFECKRITKKILDQAREYMQNVINTYAMWINGECYGYVISDDDGEEIDSCYGFIGHDEADNAAKEAMSTF